MKIVQELRELQETAETEDEISQGLREIFLRSWARYIVALGLIIIAGCFYLAITGYPELYDFKIFGWG